jgi:hypothetical protein
LPGIITSSSTKIELIVTRALQRGLAVLDPLDRKALALEFKLHQPRNLRIVFC